MMKSEMENGSARLGDISASVEGAQQDAGHGWDARSMEIDDGEIGRGEHHLFTMDLQRMCEMCKATHDGSYGTGRFCSKCACAAACLARLRFSLAPAGRGRPRVSVQCKRALVWQA